MIEVVFNQNAANSLKLAQHYGEGEFQEDGTATVFLGGEPSPLERELAERAHLEAERRAWEQAQPLGGREEDVLCLPLALSVGDISEEVPGDARRAVLARLAGEHADTLLAGALRALRAVLERSGQGEEIRIWYSAEPDEMSGLYWLLYQLDALGSEVGPVRVVRLPRFEQNIVQNGTHRANLDRVILRSGWGDVAPGEWHRFLNLEVPVSPLLIRAVAGRWRQLQQENTPLRAVFNGSLVSLPAEAYDFFIQQEMDELDNEFNEAVLVGNVLGRRRLGVSDAVIAGRVQAFVDAGALEVVRPAEDGRYDRTLRKAAVPAGPDEEDQ